MARKDMTTRASASKLKYSAVKFSVMFAWSGLRLQSTVEFTHAPSAYECANVWILNDIQGVGHIRQNTPYYRVSGMSY